MPKIKDISIAERPREKLLQKGPQFLTDAELIAILLRTGTKGKSAITLGEELLKASGGLKNLFNATYSEIFKIQGIKKAKYTTLISAIELAKRAMKEKVDRMNPIKGPKDVYEFVKAEFLCMDREVFYALYLNSKNIVTGYEKLGSGSLSSCLCQPQEFIRGLFKYASTRLILVHNHPSGEIKPSNQDILFTKELAKHLHYFGFELLDHIIVSGEKYLSIKEIESF